MSENYEKDLVETFGDGNVSVTGDQASVLPADPDLNDRIREEREAEEHKQAIEAYRDHIDRKKAVERLICGINSIQQGVVRIWPTGFSELDKKLGGGLHRGQLTVLGAISSLGKTSYALQLAEQVASQGYDVLYFSLEMGDDELLAKSISRQTHLLTCGDDLAYRRPDRLTAMDVLNGDVGLVGENKRVLFDLAVAETEKISDHLHYFVGKNDISMDEVEYFVGLHTEATGRYPLVVIDYLQILRTSQDAQDRRLEKRLMTDDDVTRLKILARDHNVPVLAISAFNRVSYLDPVSMSSFKESSGIEYSSDILIGLQFKGMDFKKGVTGDDGQYHADIYESKATHDNRVRDLYEKQQTVAEQGGAQEIELKILKNRTGAKGAIDYLFTPKYNSFVEVSPTSAKASTSKTSNKPKIGKAK